MKNPNFLPRLAAGLFTLTAATLPVVGPLALVPAPARAQEAQEVSFDFFYRNLADNGDWYNTPDFGYVFQPYIAYKNDQWRPYTDGYWAQTDQGWTWVSYEDFGWACYHYGRWSQLDNVGWVWVPGYEWAPGWVSWRTSDDYVGWAPLPPKRTRLVAAVEEEPARPPGGEQRVYQGQLVRPEDVEEDYDNGYNAGVDTQYDIGPSQYSFVPVQSFGAPYLVEAVVPAAQNIVIIEGTTNVTNIVYRRGGPRDGRLLYCGGPDYAFLSRRAERPIPRLLLERRTDVAADRASLRADQFNVVRDNRLEIVAPFIARRPVNFAQMHPDRVKETLVRPQVNHGWSTAQQQDPRLVERLRERFQQQARQAPPARQVAENYLTPAAFRAQPPPTIQEQQRLHQPPPPRTAEGNRVGGSNPPQPPAGTPPAVLVGPQPSGGPGARGVQPPPRPTGNPEVQPVPGPNGRNVTDAERQARRDAQRREMEQRQPGNRPPAAPNVVNPGNGSVPPAPVQPAARPNRTAEEREAYRASKQAARPQPETNNPGPGAPSQPFQAPAPTNRERPARPTEREQPAAQPNRPAPDPNAERAREERRAARLQEQQQAQQAQQQQRQQQAAERARAERPAPQPAERPRVPQNQEREQRRAERPPQPEPQAPRPAPEARRPAPEARPQPQPQPGQNPNEERKHKRDGQPD